MTANRQMALRLVWGTRIDDDTPAADARELLAMCGLIEPDGHEILPDITGGTLVGPSAGKAPGKTHPSSSPLAQAESGRRPENCTTPPGLRDLPPLAAAPRPAAAPRKVQPPSPKAPQPQPRVKGQKAPIAHGTLTGYVEHSRRKEPIPHDDPCGCRAVGTAYHRERAAKRRAAGSLR